MRRERLRRMRRRAWAAQPESCQRSRAHRLGNSCCFQRENGDKRKWGQVQLTIQNDNQNCTCPQWRYKTLRVPCLVRPAVWRRRDLASKRSDEYRKVTHFSVALPLARWERARSNRRRRSRRARVSGSKPSQYQEAAPGFVLPLMLAVRLHG